LAVSKSIPVTVDPKKNNYAVYKNITLFKPNFKEFVEGSRLEILKADTAAIFKNAQRLIEEQNIEMVFVTLSELGVFICDKHNYHIIPAEYRQITDVSGAGDTVISVATILLMNGFDKETIASISNKAGGLVCEKVGVVPISIKDIMKEISEV
jgi:rfaE bifunctional protein kinase chain/domain